MNKYLQIVSEFVRFIQKKKYALADLRIAKIRLQL